MLVCYTWLSVCDTLKEKLESFYLTSWVNGRTKIGTENPTNWRIFESSWLDIENDSQYDSILRVKMTLNIESIWLKYSQITRIPGSNFVLPVTQLFM